MLLVKDLFSIRAIEGLKLVAGEEGLNNRISIVNIIENPDAFDWLSQNELLLSTGYIFKESEELQNRVIKELAEINCAGLVIKMKRYFDSLPQNMIDQANKYGLPLIELPNEYTLSKVISIINEKTSGTYDLVNRKTLDIHNLFFQITLEGGGINKITKVLSSLLDNPVIIVDEFWDLINYVDFAHNPIPLHTALTLEKNKQVFNEELIQSMPQDISDMNKSIKRFYPLDDQVVKCRIFPIRVMDRIYGYIIVWQTISPLSELDYIALERASTIIALERLKTKEIEDVQSKIKHDFFDDLIFGKITSLATLKTLCDLHGLSIDYWYTCLVAHINHGEITNDGDLISEKYRLEAIGKKCVEFIYQNFSQTNWEVTSFYRNNRVIILVGQNKNKGKMTVTEIKNYAKKLYELWNQLNIKVTFQIGIGQQYPSISEVYKSYTEANEVLRLLKYQVDQSTISHFEDFAINYLLESNIKESVLKDFLTKYLGKLMEHDSSHQTSYIYTLECYFQHHLNVSETAKVMYLHRNTLIYRIERMKEILQNDLKNSEDLLKIQIALKIYRILSKNNLFD